MAERWEILNSASPTETRSTARLRAPLRVTKKENLFRRSGGGFASGFEELKNTQIFKTKKPTLN